LQVCGKPVYLIFTPSQHKPRHFNKWLHKEPL